MFSLPNTNTSSISSRQNGFVCVFCICLCVHRGWGYGGLGWKMDSKYYPRLELMLKSYTALYNCIYEMLVNEVLITASSGIEGACVFVYVCVRESAFGTLHDRFTAGRFWALLNRFTTYPGVIAANSYVPLWCLYFLTVRDQVEFLGSVIFGLLNFDYHMP